ncbi:septation ring formation regulator EzrA [Virgibacillus halophilus]|uniref:Septation ring formation regulator EzrA n=1 Tax=Tigheibacillus halophilus TaxID=361280 RepID=A0ABU5CCA7_9BACI|nr:septation ring formation regulator EzrA [Virgibacillus halophilus]
MFEQRLKQLDKQLDMYNGLAGDGNYMEAKDLMEELKNDLEALQEVVDVFPEIYRACKHDLPSQLSELKNGLKEMKNEGFVIEHLGFEEEMKEFEKKLDHLIGELDNGEITASQKFIPELDERLKEIYQALEDEAVAKGYVTANLPGYESSLEETAAAFAETKSEVELLARAYYISDGDMEKYRELDKQINRLQKQYEMISNQLEENNSSNLEIREQIESGFSQLKAIKEKHNDFKKHMENIRGDEMKAREQLSQLREQIHVTYRRLKKSNIPGVPGFIYSSIEKSTQQVDQVLQALERQPLDMAQVQAALEQAKKANDHLVEQTDMILDQAYYTERVIQYANRYRSRYPQLASELKESERLFRSYEYELALEKAARAVEEIEPGALKKIEQYQEMNA